MKMKKLTAMIMAGAMMLTLLTACGGNGNTETKAPETNPPADTAAPVETGAPAGLTTVEEGKLIMSTNAQFPLRDGGRRRLL